MVGFKNIRNEGELLKFLSKYPNTIICVENKSKRLKLRYTQ
jgi:hypothetical protein